MIIQEIGHHISEHKGPGNAQFIIPSTMETKMLHTAQMFRLELVVCVCFMTYLYLIRTEPSQSIESKHTNNVSFTWYDLIYRSLHSTIVEC